MLSSVPFYSFSISGRPCIAAAKSLQSCPTLCNPIDCSPLGSPIPGILQARTLEWVAISFSNTWKWKVKMKSLSCVRLLATPWTAAYQAPPSMGFSRQEYWSGALYYMPTDIIIFSHPRILQVWELLWSPFCIQENANFKRLKNFQGHTSQKWCTQNLNSHSAVLDSKFFEPCYSVCSETPSSSHCSPWTLPSTSVSFFCLPSVSFLLTLSWL